MHLLDVRESPTCLSHVHQVPPPRRGTQALGHHAATTERVTTARRVWLDTRLVCVRCTERLFGVTPCGDGWTYLSCPLRDCRATWIALTVPAHADGHWLRRTVGRGAAAALLELLEQRPGQPVLTVATTVAYLQVEVTGAEFRPYQHEPLTVLLDALKIA